MSRKPNIPPNEGFIERRLGGERRTQDRRSNSERRHDFRDGAGTNRKTIRVWLRTLTKARLGVDRRKGERRSSFDRRQKNCQSILTQDELNDLLSH